MILRTQHRLDAGLVWGWLAPGAAHCVGLEGTRNGKTGSTTTSIGFTLGAMSMTMTITLPDNMARRIESVAAARGETVQEFTVEALDASPLLADPGVDDPTVGVDALEAFLGSAASGDPDWAGTDSRVLRREIAERRTVDGIENV